MCRIASHFLLQSLKGRMSGDARDFNNSETRAVIKFLFSSDAKVIAAAETWLDGNFLIFFF